jgi:hypothetical protein
MTSERNGDETSVPIARPSESLTTDGLHRSVGFQKNSMKSSEPIVRTYTHIDGANPVVPMSNSREETHNPTTWVSDSLLIDNKNNTYQVETESVDSFFFENFRRKAYSCRSLDLDSDFDSHHMKPPKDLRVEHKIDTIGEADGLDHLFAEKEIKSSLNTMSFRDISTWSLWKTDPNLIRETLNEEEKVSCSLSEYYVVEPLRT